MNTADITISVIIPLFNGARVITHGAGQRVRADNRPDRGYRRQRWFNRRRPAVVAQYATNQPLILLRKPNGGQSSARNFGVEPSMWSS